MEEVARRTKTTSFALLVPLGCRNSFDIIKYGVCLFVYICTKEEIPVVATTPTAAPRPLPHALVGAAVVPREVGIDRTPKNTATRVRRDISLNIT